MIDDAKVAAEKAGILKPGVPTVLGELPAEVLHVVEAKAFEVGAPLHRVGRAGRIVDVRVHSTGTEFTYRSPAWPHGVGLEVAGESQVVPDVGAERARGDVARVG